MTIELTKAERAQRAEHKAGLVEQGERVRRTYCPCCGWNVIANTDGVDRAVWQCTNCHYEVFRG